jgi:hypothetical protein
VALPVSTPVRVGVALPVAEPDDGDGVALGGAALPVGVALPLAAATPDGVTLPVAVAVRVPEPVDVPLAAPDAVLVPLTMGAAVPLAVAAGVPAADGVGVTAAAIGNTADTVVYEDCVNTTIECAVTLPVVPTGGVHDHVTLVLLVPDVCVTTPVHGVVRATPATAPRLPTLVLDVYDGAVEPAYMPAKKPL